MGRGRQKAKHTKVARDLKYFSPDTNYGALEEELAGNPRLDEDLSKWPEYVASADVVDERRRGRVEERLGDSSTRARSPAVGADQPDGAAVDTLRTLHEAVSPSCAPTVTRPATQAGSPDAVRACVTELAASGVHDRDHPDAEVPGALGLFERQAAPLREHPEHRLRAPGRAVELDPRAVRQHARQVGGDAAAGDVAEGVDGVRAGRRAAAPAASRRAGSVRAARRRSGRRTRRRGRCSATPRLGEDAAHQREAVAVQSARRDRDHDVAVLHPLGAEHGIRLDHSDRGARDVVVVGLP